MLFFNKANRVSRNALFSAREAELLFGCGFYAHKININRKRVGDIFSHFVNIRRKFRNLSYNSAVNVYNTVALLYKQRIDKL